MLITRHTDIDALARVIAFRHKVHATRYDALLLLKQLLMIGLEGTDTLDVDEEIWMAAVAATFPPHYYG